MSHIATLVSHPHRPALTADRAKRAAEAVGGGVEWLARDIACDIELPDRWAPAPARARLAEALADHPVDVIVHDRTVRRKRLLIADMDSTMIDQECIDELAAEAGLKDEVAAITARAMNGEIAFEPALRERVALLKGLAARVIERVLADRITFASGARALVATMRARGGYCLLVSGGFTAFAGPIASELGFDEHRANRLIEEGGMLTGTVGEPILGRAAKVDALRETCDRLSISSEDAIAVGDGANDLDMLAEAGIGVAMHAKPAVAALASHRVDHGDLTALLYIQGYTAGQIIGSEA